MRFLADANIARRVVIELRRGGHDVAYAIDLAPRLQDERLLAISARQRRILLTLDRDFGELVFRRRAACHGVLLIRLRPPTPERQVRLVLTVVRARATKLAGRFTVADGRGVRSRPVR